MPTPHQQDDGSLPACPASPPPPPSPPPPLPVSHPPPLPPPAPPATFTCCSGQASCGSANNNPVTCSALGDLYASTNGAGWLVRGNWSSAAAGTATDYCTLSNATCSAGVLISLCVPALLARLFFASDRTEIALRRASNLGANQLVGTLPSSLGSLTGLILLYVTRRRQVLHSPDTAHHSVRFVRAATSTTTCSAAPSPQVYAVSRGSSDCACTDRRWPTRDPVHC